MAIAGSNSSLDSQDDWQVFRLLARREWLRSAWQCICCFLPVFIPAQVLIVGAEFLIMILSTLALDQMNASSPGFSNFLLAAAYLLISLLAGAPLLLYGLGKLIFRLTVFCRFWLMVDNCQGAESQDLTRLRTEALKALSERKRFLGGYWLFCSLLMLPLTFTFCLLASIKFAISDQQSNLLNCHSVSELISLGLNCHSTGEVMTLGLMLACVVYIVTVSALMFPVGAVQETSAWHGAVSTFTLAFKRFPQSVPICILVGLMNVIVNSANFFSRSNSVHSLWPANQSLFADLLLLVWQGILLLFLLPASILPFCELWKTSGYEHE